MKLLQKISTLVLALLLAGSLPAQNKTYDVFIPISKYIATGNVDNLSAWFADNLEISILANSSNSSKAQAKQILKAFFDAHTPRSFDISHTASKVNMKYALGTLTAGGERFIVTIFVNYDGESYKIQQLKIDRQ
ncbi:MAG: DUF4783 domain-containing protein [Bacteroidales bacterium]|nr:DUF4783 domain-containing protein [Bacteroidales bacterium]MBP5635627.1 DUF4783 domain-containing protein [Bacteroidales bacterium]